MNPREWTTNSWIWSKAVRLVLEPNRSIIWTRESSRKMLSCAAKIEFLKIYMNSQVIKSRISWFPWKERNSKQSISSNQLKICNRFQTKKLSLVNSNTPWWCRDTIKHRLILNMTRLCMSWNAREPNWKWWKMKFQKWTMMPQKQEKSWDRKLLIMKIKSLNCELRFFQRSIWVKSMRCISVSMNLLRWRWTWKSKIRS